MGGDLEYLLISDNFRGRKGGGREREGKTEGKTEGRRREGEGKREGERYGRGMGCMGGGKGRGGEKTNSVLLGSCLGVVGQSLSDGGIHLVINYSVSNETK